MVNGKLLKTVRFHETEQWNVKYFFATEIASEFPINDIGKHVIHITKKTKLFDQPDKEFKILGISNEKGMFDAYTEIGKNINQPYIYVENGCLAYNPYRVNVGSIGLKTNELVNEYISPAYVVFKCKETLLPEYLYFILKTAVFKTLIQDNTTGSVRQTLSYDKLTKIKIPVPPLDTQLILINQYKNELLKVKKLEEDITILEKKSDEYLLSSLGVSIENIDKLKGNLIRPFRLKSLSRWDAWTQTNKYTLSKYQFSKLSSVVVGKPLYGANEKTVKTKSDIRYIRITDIHEDGTLGDDFVSAKKTEEKYLLEENDFLIARSGNTVGKTFLYKEYFGKCIFAGYLVRYKLNTQKIIPEYLLYYTKSSLFKTWIQNNQRIFGQPNINGQEYLNADIIIPDIFIQQEIVTCMGEIYNEIKRKKAEVNNVTLCAKKQFEEAVFGETQDIKN